MTDEPILNLSLKDYKDKIEELKEALSELEKGSAKYAETAEAIKKIQEELNSVISAGKKEVDELTESYQSLSSELSKLKDGIGSVETGSAQWSAMGEQISELKSKFESLSKAVGDYGDDMKKSVAEGVSEISKIEVPSLDTTSLKDYKKSIDDLRASLLTLDSGSREYSEISDQIREMQSKLNEVMAVGKRNVEGVAGSYNALSQEMSRLKKEWKTLEIGSEKWVAMGQQIDALNDKLKSADASVGVFSRNVGDYENAFTKALETSVQEISKLDGPLGNLMGTVKALVPVIKTANATAVKGLSGVKKALVSTGVGALVVAVGLLVANWDKLVKLFKKSEPETQKLIESNDTLTKGFEEQNRKLENEITMMQADGASADEVNAKKQALIATQIAETRATIEETKAKIAQIGKHSLLGRILRGENKEFKGLKETLEELEKTETKLVQSEEKINANAYADRRNKAKAAAEKEIEEVKRVLKEVEDASKKETDKLTEKYQKELKLLKKHNKDTAALTAKYNKELAELNRKSEKEIESAVASANDKISQYYTKFGLKNELEGAKKRLDEFNTLAKKDFPPKGLIETVLAGKDIKEVFGDMYDEAAKEAKKLDLITTDSAEEFVSAWIGAYEQWKDARLKLNTYDEQYAKEMKENYFNYIDEIRKKWQSTDSIFEEVKRNGMATVDWNLFNRRDPVKIELEFELANEKTTLESVKRTIGSLYDEANKIATNNFGFDFQLVPDDDSLETLKSLIGESQELEQIYEKIYEYTQKANEAQGNIAGIEKEIEARKSYMKYVQDQIREVNSENQNIGIISTKNFNEYYEARIQTAIDYIDYVKKLEYDSEQERQLALAEAYAQETEAEREYFQARLNNHLEFVNQVANVYGSIADILDESIQHQKDNLIAQGKTEEEANKMLEGKFEYVKGFQIAQAVINTISGALAAFTASQELGQPWGMAIGIAQAAAVTAAGVAQIQKIANTEIGSTSSSVGTVTANSTPKLLDYQPSTTQNITGASDEEKLQKTLENTQIWVSVKDINSAQDRGRTRVAEASF